MPSRENLVILASLLLLFLFVLLGMPLLDRAVGVDLNRYPLPAFVLVAGLAVVVPQLSLARTDDAVTRRTRIRFAVIATGVFAVTFAGDTQLEDGLGWHLLSDLEALQSVLVLAIGAGAFLGLVAYEFAVGYRSGAEDPQR
ncbi:hypothetical protein [Halopiger goleimassiliensis]|uniref:hypothetical protein n=1 Tax=Halopiger goleimassiliensis TaxID=1293048 RepID=UPI0006777E0A|nr:hypothetical protein [Halopiger goleimassiliensis]